MWVSLSRSNTHTILNVMYTYLTAFMHDYRLFRLVSPGNNVLTYQLQLLVERLQSLIARSSVEEERMSALSTAMTHHKTSGPRQVNGELVAVGGWNKSNAQIAKEVYTYDKQTQKWKPTIPPMPTARHSQCVLSLQSALVIAGGISGYASPPSYTATVEVFKPDTSQWYRTDSLPTVCQIYQ